MIPNSGEQPSKKGGYAVVVAHDSVLSHENDSFDKLYADIGINAARIRHDLDLPDPWPSIASPIVVPPKKLTRVPEEVARANARENVADWMRTFTEDVRSQKQQNGTRQTFGKVKSTLYRPVDALAGRFQVRHAGSPEQGTRRRVMAAAAGGLVLGAAVAGRVWRPPARTWSRVKRNAGEYYRDQEKGGRRRRTTVLAGAVAVAGVSIGLAASMGGKHGVEAGHAAPPIVTSNPTAPRHSTPPNHTSKPPHSTPPNQHPHPAPHPTPTEIIRNYSANHIKLVIDKDAAGKITDVSGELEPGGSIWSGSEAALRASGIDHPTPGQIDQLKDEVLDVTGVSESGAHQLPVHYKVVYRTGKDGRLVPIRLRR